MAQSLASKILELRKRLQVWVLKVYTTLTVLRVVHRPRIQRPEVLGMEQKHALVPPHLPEDVVLGVVVAWRKVSFLPTKQLARLYMPPRHLLSKPLPLEFPDVSGNLNCASHAEASYWFWRTVVLLSPMQKSTLKVERATSLARRSLLLSQLLGGLSEFGEPHLKALVALGDWVVAGILLLGHIVVSESALTRGWGFQNEEVVHIRHVFFQVFEVPELWCVSQQIAVRDDQRHLAPQQSVQFRILSINSRDFRIFVK
eukprot:CAMPEP_0206427886 /NCGR_PEP_ID=MMETSP0324_2-20121206/5316_1 /ASSEMBLY_ACC=CAM_ASM_000836 /TAXON_ID=2866 /ORGANISM="Crypthecodinium cohnii, Strain Seligo" /LENGTH=256 /DNA_ID=CAMNT_0053893269 /DNA_START=744 /DNA_END=1514 /DNA_ORIENTATION=+